MLGDECFQESGAISPRFVVHSVATWMQKQPCVGADECIVSGYSQPIEGSSRHAHAEMPGTPSRPVLCFLKLFRLALWLRARRFLLPRPSAMSEAAGSCAGSLPLGRLGRSPPRGRKRSARLWSCWRTLKHGPVAGQWPFGIRVLLLWPGEAAGNELRGTSRAR